MYKKLLAIAAIALLSSCAGKHLDGKDKDFVVEDPSKKQNYETVQNQQQAEDLNKQTEAQIEEIEVKDRVLFGYDSTALSDEAQKILDTQVMWLTNDSGIKITVEGHCDERGTREYNIALGEKRADAVREYLVKNGIDSSRVKIVSYGKERPAFFGDSEEVMAKNRRAVVVVN